jgi:hypothetical protein
LTYFQVVQSLWPYHQLERSGATADARSDRISLAPFAPVPRGETYHFACATDLETRPHIVTLRNWFLRVMRESREATLR